MDTSETRSEQPYRRRRTDVSVSMPATEAIDEIGRELESVAKSFGEAFTRGDAEAVASHFTPDGTVIDPTGRLATGRGEIEQVVGENLSGFLGGSTSRFTIRRIRPLEGGLLFADLVHEFSGLKTAGMPERMALSVVVLAKKVGDRWMLVDGRPHTYLKP